MDYNIQVPEKLLPIFTTKKRFIVLEGGRNGSKSWSAADLVLIKGIKKKLRILCAREVQKSIAESVHQLLENKINENKYPYKVLKNSIINPFNDTGFIFHGLRYDTSRSIKSLEGVDICWCEEAQFISKQSLDILIPTIRKPGSQIIFTFNRLEEVDPVYGRFCLKDDPDVLHININYDENRFCPENQIIEAEKCKKNNYEDFLHIWKGQPMSQGENKVLKITDIKKAMERKIIPVGGFEMGIDVARFGDDRTVISKRQGLKLLCYRVFKGLRTYEIVEKAMEIAGDDLQDINIKIDDTGVGGGVTDGLHKINEQNRLEAQNWRKEPELKPKTFIVTPINNNQTARDNNKYADAITEMYFEFKESIEQIELINDPDLLRELVGREYFYDKQSRKKIESKDEYKKRYKKSPDIADSILLCFYNYRKSELRFG